MESRNTSETELYRQAVEIQKVLIEKQQEIILFLREEVNRLNSLQLEKIKEDEV